MCFSSGKSADAYYQEIKPTFGDLPSLGTGGARRTRKSMLRDIRPEGMQARNFMDPTGV